MKTGDQLRLLRSKKEYTLKQLAESTGLSISFISDIENGRRNPSLSNLEKIAQSLGVSLSEFLGTNENKMSFIQNEREQIDLVKEASVNYPSTAPFLDDLLKKVPDLTDEEKESLEEHMRFALRIIEKERQRRAAAEKKDDGMP